MKNKSANQKEIQKKLTEYKKTNPKVAEALNNYEKVKLSRTGKMQTGSYRTSTSTKLSSIFTTR